MKCLAKVAQLTRQAQTLLPLPVPHCPAGRDTSQLVISDCAPSLDLCCMGFVFCCFFRFWGPFLRWDHAYGFWWQVAASSICSDGY